MPITDHHVLNGRIFGETTAVARRHHLHDHGGRPRWRGGVRVPLQTLRSGSDEQRKAQVRLDQGSGDGAHPAGSSRLAVPQQEWQLMLGATRGEMPDTEKRLRTRQRVQQGVPVLPAVKVAFFPCEPNVRAGI